MEIRRMEPPRSFRVGRDPGIELVHVADVELDDDEQVTFTAATGSEYDVVRKDWGYYATPSLNSRLPAHGLRPALCLNADGRRSLLLVESGRDSDFHAYLAAQGMEVVAWLDGEPCPMCGAFALETWHRYDAPPSGETTFDLGGEEYRRRYLRCKRCGHMVGDTELDLAGLYDGSYVDATYSGKRMSESYERIMALAPEQSDNLQRVRRIVARCGSAGTLLDVGSGLGVFPARMTEAGWSVTALDPDERAIAHIRERAPVEGVVADFLADPLEDLGRFDLVTLNKVLEHVQDPRAMLRRCGAFLAPGGTVYVEVPDAEAAAAEGPEREEFFIEHLHVFSAASVALLAAAAGLRVASIERLQEPSTKYTLVAFLEAG